VRNLREVIRARAELPVPVEEWRGDFEVTMVRSVGPQDGSYQYLADRRYALTAEKAAEFIKKGWATGYLDVESLETYDRAKVVGDLEYVSALCFGDLVEVTFEVVSPDGAVVSIQSRVVRLADS
jgi:hypothetical protein